MQARRNETYAGLMVSVLSLKTACRWFERFRNGDFSLGDEPRSGRSTEIDLSELKDVIESDPALTSPVYTTQYTHRAILHQFKQLCLVSKLGQWVPHDLTPDRGKNRVDYSQLLFSLHRTPDWLRNLIIGDGKWCLYVNVKRRRQWLK